MKARQFDDEEATEIEASIDSQDNNTTSKVSASTKLERRRRIEDLNEEKRLREELNEF